MLIIRNEDYKIVEMFDTVKEFKAYIDETLLFLEKEINEEYDGFGFKFLFDKPLEDVCFEDKFKMYRETINNEVEVR